MAKNTTVIAIAPINHDGADVAPGETLDGLTEMQAEQLVDARVAVPNTTEGKKFAKEFLAKGTPEVVTDDKAPTAEVTHPANKKA